MVRTTALARGWRVVGADDAGGSGAGGVAALDARLTVAADDITWVQVLGQNPARLPVAA